VAESDPLGQIEMEQGIKKFMDGLPNLIKIQAGRAKIAREYYNELIKAGFSDSDALTIVAKSSFLSM